MESRTLFAIDFASQALSYLRSEGYLSSSGAVDPEDELIATLAVSSPVLENDAFIATAGTEMTEITAQELQAFQRVWQSLSPDEILSVLLANKTSGSTPLVNGYTDFAAFKTEVADRLAALDPFLELEDLRPDGVLTLLATLPDNDVSLPANEYSSLLTLGDGSDVSSETDVGDARATWYALLHNFADNPYAFLDPLPVTTLVGLFDNSFAAGGSTGDAIPVFPTVSLTAPLGGQISSVADRFSDTLSMHRPGYYTSVMGPAANAAKSVDLEDLGKPIVLFNAGIEDLDEGSPPPAYSPPYYQGFVDPNGVQDASSPFGSGSQSPYYLVWIDDWADDVRSRFEDWLQEYQENGGATIEKFILDVEDNSLVFEKLRQDANTSPSSGIRIVPGRSPYSSPSTYTGLLGDLWDALIHDTRWPALKQELLEAGLPDDIDVRSSPNWIGNWGPFDKNAQIWNAVLERRRNEALEHAFLEVIHLYQNPFDTDRLSEHPDTHDLRTVFAQHLEIANYGQLLHTQTNQTPDPYSFGTGYHTAGHMFGDGEETFTDGSNSVTVTTKSVSNAYLYGENTLVQSADVYEDQWGNYPGTLLLPGSFEDSSDKVKGRRFTVDSVSFAPESTTVTTAGTVTLTLNAPMYGIVKDDVIRLYDQRGLASFNGWYFEDPVTHVAREIVVTCVSSDFKTIVGHIADTGTTPNASTTGWDADQINISVKWKPFNAFLGDVQRLRSQSAASEELFSNWIANRNYVYTNTTTGWGTSPSRNGGVFEYYNETIRQALVSGAKELYWWRITSSWANSSEISSNQSNADEIELLLDEIEGITGESGQSIVLDSNRRAISMEEISPNAGYVLTGIEGAGRRLWRLSIDGDVDPGQVLNSGNLDGSEDVVVEIRGQTIRVPKAYIYTPGGGAESDHGYWIVQLGAESPVEDREAATAALEQAFKPIVTYSEAVAGQEMSFSISMNSDLFDGGDEFKFTVVIDGVEVVDSLEGTLAGFLTSHTFSTLGAHTVEVIAVDDCTQRLVGTTEIELNISSILVTTDCDSGAGSLRDAILQANAHSGTDTILFGLSAPDIIAASTSYVITDSLVIDGTSQPGYSLTERVPVIVLDGTGGSPGAAGLVLNGNDIVVRGLAITGFKGYGLEIFGDNATIENCFIGLLPGGNEAANELGGIRIEASLNSRVGNSSDGTITGKGNVIANNTGPGIYVADLDAELDEIALEIAGNLIGIGPTGASMGNTGDGILIENSSGVLVGGSDGPDTRNVISANGGNGIRISGSDSHLNVVSGNYIGVNAAGTALTDAYNNPLGNAQNGVKIEAGANANVIGTRGDEGASENERNLISGNIANGIQIVGEGTDGNRVSGNFIGTDVDGLAALANAASGIDIGDGASYTLIGRDLLDAHDELQWNLISGNDDYGIKISGPTTAFTTIRGNLIGTDSELGDLGNGLAAVLIQGSNDNLVGGSETGEGNVIWWNAGVGVTVQGVTTNGVLYGVRNSILGNSMTANFFGILLASNGNGGNGHQPTFVGGSATRNVDNSITLDVKLNNNDTVNLYDLEFFLAPATSNQGVIKLQAVVVADAGSTLTVKLTTIGGGGLPANCRIVATATDDDGNTSQFSSVLTVA